LDGFLVNLVRDSNGLNHASRRSSFGRLGVSLLVVVCGFAALFAHGRSLRAALGGSDFAAFYCAATLVREGADPYRWMPLEACERERVAKALGDDLAESDFDPAPLPGYAIAPFVPLSLLPYRTAALLWDALLLAAVIASIEVLCALTSLPRIGIAAALVGTAIVASLPYGQIAPLALLALSASGLYLARGRPGPAALCAAVSLVQPQTGLAAFLALILWVPRARPYAAAGAAGLLALSLASVGLRGDLEYLRAVLPVQALAEAPFHIQLSATWLLYFAGVEQNRALWLAQFDYALMLAAGVLLAPRVARALGSKAALVFFPPVLVLLGGTYLHVFQLAAALPFAMLFASRARQGRGAAWAAVALGSHSMLILGALTVATIVWVAAVKLRIAVRVGLAMACAGFALIEPWAVTHASGVTLRVAQSAAAFEHSGIDMTLAPARHGYELRLAPMLTGASWRTFVEKMPFWLALLLVVGAGPAAVLPPWGYGRGNSKGRKGSLEASEV
jgi:hypothetical protein